MLSVGGSAPPLSKPWLRQRRTGNQRSLASYRKGSDEEDVPPALRSSAFSYDNALAVIALLSCDEEEAARQIADAFLIALIADRSFQDGRIRNAYRAGMVKERPVLLPDGGIPQPSTGLRTAIRTDQPSATWLGPHWRFWPCTSIPVTSAILQERGRRRAGSVQSPRMEAPLATKADVRASIRSKCRWSGSLPNTTRTFWRWRIGLPDTAIKRAYTPVWRIRPERFWT